jgi:hypothetical protein
MGHKAQTNIQALVMAHQDYVTGNSDGVCIKDGCGSACFHGFLAWQDAARFLGFRLDKLQSRLQEDE